MFAVLKDDGTPDEGVLESKPGSQTDGSPREKDTGRNELTTEQKCETRRSRENHRNNQHHKK